MRRPIILFFIFLISSFNNYCSPLSHHSNDFYLKDHFSSCPFSFYKLVSDSSNFKPHRFYPAIAGTFICYGVTLTGLNELWYADYPRAGFHFFNDNAEWLQMDKLGHSFTSYYESILGMELLKWCGVKEKKAIAYGGLWGILLQTPIEVLDGFSSKWGFSTGDGIANVMGSALAISQELLFNEQKLIFKFSYFPSDYASKRPEILGNSFMTSLLKDYNAQTIWLSTSLNNLTGKRKIFPDWLCLSVGYGASGMLGGDSNPDEFENINRYRQFYLSFDVNTLKLKGKNKFVNSLLTVVSFIKFPAPALEFNNNDGNNFRFHLISF